MAVPRGSVSEPDLATTIRNINSSLEAITHFLVDVPTGSEVPDACRETAFCWATLAKLKEEGDLNDYSYGVVSDAVKRLQRATKLLEKIYAKGR